MKQLQLTWVCKPFNELTTTELYKILQLRSEVFVVEQNCPYLDADSKDFKSTHLMAWDCEILVAYTRLLPQRISYVEASIGRVVTSPKYRGIGAGVALMQNSIEKVYELYGKGDIKIGAQLYLKKFYERYGFVQTSEEYLDDDIPHIEMVKPNN